MYVCLSDEGLWPQCSCLREQPKLLNPYSAAFPPPSPPVHRWPDFFISRSLSLCVRVHVRGRVYCPRVRVGGKSEEYLSASA